MLGYSPFFHNILIPPPPFFKLRLKPETMSHYPVNLPKFVGLCQNITFSCC